MRRSTPQLALRAQVGLPEGLMNQVSEGILDIAVLYAPQLRPGLKVELLMEEKLLLVTTRKSKGERSAADYVYVDWGPDFAAQHSLSFPEFSNPGTFVGLGPLGLQYILKAGGTGYFRAHAAAPYLRSRRLRLVRGAPEYLYPVYAVYSEGADLKVVAPALAGLHHIAKKQGEPRARPGARERKRAPRRPAGRAVRARSG
jgi:hypothetical protein